MLRKVHLHGRLAKYGGPYDLDVKSAAEAVHALGCQLRGFRSEFEKGYFQVIKGDLRSGLELDISICQFNFRSGDFHIVPVPRGRGKGKGIGKIVLGVAIMAAAVYFALAAGAGATGLSGALGADLGATAIGVLGITYGHVAGFGALMVLGGVSQLLTRSPGVGSYGDRNAPDERPSFLFNGPVNVTEQGGPVPLVYGRFRVGSVVVSAGLRTEQIAAER